MNKDLQEIVKKYAASTHADLNNCLLGKSKDNLIGIICDLITLYINDKNSSTLREFVTVSLSNYEHIERKIGYNGFKQTATIGQASLYCEAKPKNFDTSQLEKYNKGERKTSPQKLDGNGNFTDYTWERFEKDKAANLQMLVSGFIDGQLFYILEFPFNTPSFLNKIESELKKKFPGGDVKGYYLRSASFGFIDYMEAKELKINYLAKKDVLAKNKNCLSKRLFKFLIPTS